MRQVKKINDICRQQQNEEDQNLDPMRITTASEIGQKSSIRDLINEADKFMVHCAVDSKSTMQEAFQMEATYPISRLEKVLDEMILFIKKTQKVFMRNKE